MIDAADEQRVALPALPQQFAAVQIEAMNFGRFGRREQDAVIGDDGRAIEPLVVRPHQLGLHLLLLPKLRASAADWASRG